MADTGVNHTEYWKRSTTFSGFLIFQTAITLSPTLAEAKTLLRFRGRAPTPTPQDIGHQHDTTATITRYPQLHCSPQSLPPDRRSLVAQFHFCRLGRRAFPIVAPRPQLHLDLLISRRTTFCPEQEEPQNTIRSAKSTLNSSNIAVIAIRNSPSTITFRQHRARAGSKSLSASKRSYSTDLG